VRIDPAVVEQRRAEREKMRAAHGAELACLSRALLVASPPARPEAVALLDVGEHELTTFVGEELAALPSRLAEPMLYDLERSALAMNVPLEVVIGSAPGWSDPWSRVRLAYVEQDANGWRTWLVDEDGVPIDEDEVQRARLRMAIH
jgi:hypothetical protein